MQPLSGLSGNSAATKVQATNDSQIPQQNDSNVIIAARKHHVDGHIDESMKQDKLCQQV